MIRFSQKEDLAEIKALWTQAFHDSKEAKDFYFDNRWREDNLLVDVEQGILRGMLSLLPIRLVSGGKSYKARYFFAIATQEDYKRRGISTGLISFAKELTKKEGSVAAVLVPANEGLFAFYEKRGFAPAFYYDLLKIDAKSLPPCPAKAAVLQAGAGDLVRLRDNSQVGSSLYVQWGEDALQFVINASQAWEAPLLRFGTEAGEGYAYCEWLDENHQTLLVKELVTQKIDVMSALAILHSRLCAKHYHVRLPQGVYAGSDPVITKLPYGMISWMGEDLMSSGTAPYLGLGKD